ncbi:hypothetical protein E4U28_001522 [Claviceps purpurea]|nr:hypothetical protein E4U28_001522 [Claviceps purpurea]
MPGGSLLYVQQLVRLRAPRTKALQDGSWNLLGRNMEKAAGWTLEVPSLLRQQPSVLLRLRRPSQAPQHFSIQEQATPLNNATHHAPRTQTQTQTTPRAATGTTVFSLSSLAG